MKSCLQPARLLGVSRTGLLACLCSAVAVGAVSQRPTLDAWKQGQANASSAEAAAAAKQSKMAAVDKVVQLLASLQTHVLREGEQEAKTYNTFSCFCKDTSSDKADAIQQGSDSKTALSSQVSNLAQQRDQLDTDIKNLLDDIDKKEKEVSTAKAQRAGELKLYEKNEADLSGAVSALENAISVLKASKTPSLVQLQSVAETLRMAMAMSDALHVGTTKLNDDVAALLQQTPTAPAVPTEDYRFHSDTIITTLEGLLKDFRAQKTLVDEDEVRAVSLHDQFLQESADVIKAKKTDLSSKEKSKAHTQEKIASTNQQLTSVAATLLDDQEYLKELSKMCSDKAVTWDQRSKVRQDELSALTAAISILKGAVSEKTTAATVRLAQRGVAVRVAEAMARTPEAMEALEADAESVETPSFLQQSEVVRSPVEAVKTAHAADDGRQMIASLLRSKGQQLRSTLLSSLAARITDDPFAKVKVLIQELIERLQKEATNELNHKGWCDKSISDAEQKRDYAARDVEELNGDMARLEALRDKLGNEIQVLASEVSALTTARAQEVRMRGEESAQNAQTVKEATEGLNAVDQAITILNRFYGAAAKAAVELSFAQRAPGDDAPDAGFKIGEAYAGSQGEAGGIVGMLEVIKGDFTRTVSETEKAEAEAAQDHLAFLTDTGKSLAQKNVAQQTKTALKDDAEKSLETAEEGLRTHSGVVQNAVKELLDLKPVCIDTGMSYDERVSRREEELEALKKGLCILEHYAQYGPDGGVDAC
mmetsp:Transcript_22935/g.64111  ORF Transcript_22935/g.64111 Transcript_22935/m.64111 type:complete len:765 (-) Transcript_22935:105-2399(-)